ncbi:MAG: hypothetical protein GYB53_18600 [Rhodobacteraceae bacterium]|nr:hypothetical protein [Paracoccaceae bacterium]MBR9819691.1 hypothetical protein [Paracoccaceae bacterium]
MAQNTKSKAATAATPALDTSALAETAARIEAQSAQVGLTDLQAQLQNESGLMFGRERGRVKAKMLGVEATGSSKDQALKNWANAARRAALQAGAA